MDKVSAGTLYLFLEQLRDKGIKLAGVEGLFSETLHRFFCKDFWTKGGSITDEEANKLRNFLEGYAESRGTSNFVSITIDFRYTLDEDEIGEFFDDDDSELANQKHHIVLECYYYTPLYRRKGKEWHRTNSFKGLVPWMEKHGLKNLTILFRGHIGENRLIETIETRVQPRICNTDFREFCLDVNDLFRDSFYEECEVEFEMIFEENVEFLLESNTEVAGVIWLEICDGGDIYASWDIEYVFPERELDAQPNGDRVLLVPGEYLESSFGQKDLELA